MSQASRKSGIAGIRFVAILFAAGLASPSFADAHCDGSPSPGGDLPSPADPYPLSAAGWGPELPNGLFASRWAEDWTCVRAAGKAPRFKAMPLGRVATLTLGTELRLRHDTYDNALLVGGNDYSQGLLRGIVGADLRFNPHLRVYGEVGTGQVDGRATVAAANMRNDASLQQMFVDARGFLGTTLVGAMFGRQEFTDGPRQLISIGDGSNLHRSWNGTRLYVHDARWRVGAFDFRVTRPLRGSFDEEVNHGERLQGLNASFVLPAAEGAQTFLDPLWFHTENRNFRSGGGVGLDDRDTFALRLWGKRGKLRFDWTAARQSGHYRDRDVEAWAVFAVQSLALSDAGWKPRLSARIDIASGGGAYGTGAYGTGTLRGFNPLYASSSYLGDGQFLSLSNLVMIAPGLALSPTPKTSLSIEYGFARRMDEDDAAYAGGLRPYAGTQLLSGDEIGGLLRIAGSWNPAKRLALIVSYEHFDAGALLERAGFPSGSYAQLGMTYRY